MRFLDLEPILSPLLWATVDAAATRLYMPERVTEDMDILVRSKDAAEVGRKLKQAGFQYKGKLSIGDNTWLSPSGLPLDVIACHEAWCEQALVEAQANRDAHGLPVLPLPFLVLMKFQASRVQDLADITRMLGQASPEQLEAVRAVFMHWQPDAMEDLESLISLGQLEMQSPADDM